MVANVASLILVMGLPSSGKSSYIKNVPGIPIDTNSIRKGVTGQEAIQTNEQELVTHLTQRSVHFYLNQGKSVIVEALFLSASERKTYIRLAKKLHAKVELHWLDPSLDVIKKRLMLQGEEAKVATLTGLAQTLDFPHLEEGIDFIHYVG